MPQSQRATGRQAGIRGQPANNVVYSDRNGKQHKYGATQALIPVKNIRNGLVETTDGRYIKILEIMPTNFSMRSAAEKNDTIYNFASWLKAAPVKVQFKVVTRRARSVEHITAVENDLKWEDGRLSIFPEELDKLRKAIEEEKNPQNRHYLEKQLMLLNDDYENLVRDHAASSYTTRQKFGTEYLKLVGSLSSHEALTRRFFLIFEYNGNRYTDYEEVLTAMRLATQHARAALSACGNDIVIPKPEEEDIYLGEILYNIINRNTCLKESFVEHVDDVVTRTMAQKRLRRGRDPVPDIPVVNFLAPKNVNLSEKKFIYIDGTYYTFLMISASGYPKSVLAGWLNSLINAGDGIDVDIFARKEDSDKIKVRLNNKLAQHITKEKDTSETNNAREDVEDALDAGFFIKQAIKNKEDFYYLNILITVTADDFRSMEIKKRTLISNLKSDDIDVFNCVWRFEQAFVSSLPLCKVDKSLERASTRNITTSGLASTFPFTSFELCDDNGVLYGVNNQNESLCIVDIFNSKIYKNANMCYLGTSGGGKTFTLQDFALRLRMRNVQSFVIAPLKGYEFRRACNFVGGEFIKISAGSEHCVSILDIRLQDSSSDEAIEGEIARSNDSLLAKKVQTLKTAFLLLIPEMTNVEEQLLDEALIETYRRKGITHNNESLFMDEDKSELKEMPILGDLYEVLQENPRLENVSAVLSLLVKGSASNFNGHTNVNLNNKYIVFDISELTGKLLPFGMFIVLDYIMGKVKEDRTAKKAVFIDEVWKLIGTGSNRNAAETVLGIFKTIRGYGGAAIAASQDLNDFFALENGKYGKGIINSSAIKIIKYLEANEAESVQEAMDLTDNEIREIRRFEREQGLFCANNSRVSVRFVATDLEKALITTDPAELEKLKQKGGYEAFINSL